MNNFQAIDIMRRGGAVESLDLPILRPWCAVFLQFARAGLS